MIGWSIETAIALLQTISYLFLSIPLFALSIYVSLPGSLILIIATDTISRERIDPIKCSIVSGLIVAVFILSFQPESIVQYTFPNGDKSLAMGGLFQYIEPMSVFFAYFIVWFYSIIIYRHAPQNLKPYSAIFLGGTSILLWGVAGLVLLRITLILPGIGVILAAVAVLLISIVLVKQPKLAFILPFRAIRLLIINTVSGVPLFVHDWMENDEQKIIDEALFSEILHGVGILLHEGVGQGDIQEIRLTKAILILQRMETDPIACVLIATNPSPSLRNALKGFTTAFSLQFANDIACCNDTAHFQKAESLIADWFAFVPSQN
jgi:hypothetical protein